MLHTEDVLERVVREVLVCESTNEVRRRGPATETVAETGSAPLAAVGE